jgi:lysophospholipase L1-like esterase
MNELVGRSASYAAACALGLGCSADPGPGAAAINEGDSGPASEAAASNDVAASYDVTVALDGRSGNDGGNSIEPDSAGPSDATVGTDVLGESDSAAGMDSGDQSDSKIAEASAPAVRFIGRFDMSNPSQPTAEWSASAIEARFSGSSVSVRLGGTGNYYTVVLDSAVLPVLKTSGAPRDLIASGLAAGAHQVLVLRRDEAFDQPSQFLGFDFGPGGQLLPPPSAAPRRIEVIGDSISAGFGNECANAQEQFTAATENEYIAYGPLSARSLNADIHVVAWSGKGMYRNLDGTTTETMPILWQRTIPTDKNSHWDPSRWVPDAVVINLGTNDYNASGADPTTEYQATYLQFVSQLRSVYPGALLFCAVGPMLGGTRYTAVKTVIGNVIAMRAAAGDTRLRLVEFPTHNCGADGSQCGCAGHPNAAEHATMATTLEAAMRTALGW